MILSSTFVDDANGAQDDDDNNDDDDDDDDDDEEDQAEELVVADDQDVVSAEDHIRSHLSKLRVSAELVQFSEKNMQFSTICTL